MNRKSKSKSRSKTRFRFLPQTSNSPQIPPEIPFHKLNFYLQLPQIKNPQKTQYYPLFRIKNPEELHGDLYHYYQLILNPQKRRAILAIQQSTQKIIIIADEYQGKIFHKKPTKFYQTPIYLPITDQILISSLLQ